MCQWGELKRPSGLELMCTWPAANGYTLLHSGIPAPPSDDTVARREGVGLALDVIATVAWRMAGEVWKPLSCRVIMASARRDQMYLLSLLFVPALLLPRFPQLLGHSFWNSCRIHWMMSFVMLGVFNARVGMFDPADGLWYKTIGRYGLVERNRAGEELLHFVNSINLLY